MVVIKKPCVFRLGCVFIVCGIVCIYQFIIPRFYTSILERFDVVYPGPMSVDTRFMHKDKIPHHDSADISQADPNTCATSSNSIMRLSSHKTEYQLGETIQVQIQLFDSYKQRKTRGGDLVRIWMKEKCKNASAAGVITDHNNGSYTGTLKALWTGSPRIEASIAGCRETIEIFYRIYRDHYSLLYYFTALFKSDDIKEITECLPIPKIPGHTHVCNLTSENYGLPWYCGKPSHRKLLCHDFSGLAQYGGHMALFTPNEARFFDGKRLHQKLPGPIRIRVVSDKEIVALPTTPCNKSPLRQSWEASTPVGFFYQNHWKSLTCNNTIDPPDRKIYRKCLKDRTLWIHGDSTSRQWFKNFQKRLGMDIVTENWNKKKWHKPSVLRERLLNYTIMLIFHEYPFYHGGAYTKLTYNRATHAYLDNLPSDSRDIFVMHLYLHFQPSPPEVYRTHIRRIVNSVRSLVSRAPGVKIAIRGTHAFIGGNDSLGYLDDCWMFVYDRIIRDEFKGLEDKVLFLNNIDLTIATENFDAHPNDLAVDSLINHFMGYVCDV